MSRSIDEIRREYQALLADLGDKDFRKAVLEAQIQELRIKLSDLNKEAQAIPQQVLDVPPAVEPEVMDEQPSKAE